jgi:hypothetical protein
MCEIIVNTYELEVVHEKTMGENGLLHFLRVICTEPRHGGRRPAIVLERHGGDREHKSAEGECMRAYDARFAILVRPETGSCGIAWSNHPRVIVARFEAAFAMGVEGFQRLVNVINQQVYDERLH